jgi:hypothetical protein
MHPLAFHPVGSLDPVTAVVVGWTVTLIEVVDTLVVVVALVEVLVVALVERLVDVLVDTLVDSLVEVDFLVVVVVDSRTGIRLVVVARMVVDVLTTAVVPGAGFPPPEHAGRLPDV